MKAPIGNAPTVAFDPAVIFEKATCKTLNGAISLFSEMKRLQLQSLRLVCNGKLDFLVKIITTNNEVWMFYKQCFAT